MLHVYMLNLLNIHSTLFSGQEAEEEVDPIEALGKTIPGLPGDDYPIFAFPPDTSFLCDGRIEAS